MSIQYINTGSGANAGDGDSLRSAFIKVNNNFTKFAHFEDAKIGYTGSQGHIGYTGSTGAYAAIGYTGSAGLLLTVTTTTAFAGVQGQIWFNQLDGRAYIRDNNTWFDLSPSIAPDPSTYLDGLTINGTTISTVDTTASIYVSSDLIPESDNLYDLGSADRQWKSLYVSTNTVYIGGTPLSINADGNLTVDGNPVIGSTRWDATADEPNGCPMFVELNPGHFHAYTQKSHIRLENNGYWDIGSTILGNGVEGYFDGNTTVFSTGTVKIRSGYSPNEWTFGTDGKLTLPEGGAFTSPNYGFSFNKNSGKTGAPEIGTDVTFATENLSSDIVDGEVYMGSGYGEFRSIYNKVDSTESGLAYAGVEGFNYANFGDVNFAGMVSQTPNIDSMYTVGLNTLSQITIGFTQNGQKQQSTDWSVAVGSLTTDYTVNGLFADTTQTVISGSQEIKLTTNRGTVLFGNQPEQCEPLTLSSHFHIMKQDPGLVDLFFGDDFNYVKLPGDGETAYGVEIGTNVGDGANSWRFGTDGILNLPNNNGQIGQLESPYTGLEFRTGSGADWIGISYGEINDNNTSYFYFDKDGSDYTTANHQAHLQLKNPVRFGEGHLEWLFDADGNLTIPNGGKLGFDLLADHTYGTIVLQSAGGAGTYAAIAGHWSYVMASDNEVRIQTGDEGNPYTAWTFGADGVLTLPSGNTRIGDVNGSDAIVSNTGTAFGVVTQGTGGYAVLEWVDNIENLGTTSTQVAIVVVNSPFASSTGTVQILTGVSTGTNSSNIWEFDATGTLTIPDDIQDANGSVVRVATTSTAPTRVEGQLWFNTDDGRGYIRYDNTWMDLSPTEVPPPSTYLDGLTIDGTTISAIDSTATVSIESGSNMWDFSSTGTLTLPNGSTIGSAEYFSGIPLTTERGTILFGNSPPIGFSSHFHIMKEDPTNVDLFLGDDTNFVKLPTTGGVEITSENTSTWTFGADGRTSFPNYTFQAGDGTAGQVLVTNGSGSVTWTTPIAATGNANTGDFTFVATTLALATDLDMTLHTNGKDWVFGSNGNLTFPDGTVNSGGTVVTGGVYDIQSIGNTLIQTHANATAQTWTFGDDGNLTLPTGGDIRDETSNISVLKTRIGDTYASGAFQQLTIAHDEGKLITIAGGNSVFRLPQMTADMLGAEFEFYFSGDAGQIHIQSYYTGVRATTDVFRGSIYVGVDNATTGKLHKATATTATACDLFLGQHHAKAESYVKVKAIAFDVVGTWMFQGMCVGDTGQTPNSSDHPFQDYN